MRLEISPHYLRHAYAGNLLLEGKAIEVICDTLGQEEVHATEFYLDFVPMDIVESYRRCMA